MDTTPDDDLRTQALKRLRARRKWIGDFTAYVAVNAALVVVWALTGRGSFWPGWVLGIWGLFLIIDALKAWTPVFTRPITEEDVAREVERLRGGTGRGASAPS